MTIDYNSTLVTVQIAASPDADAEQIDLLARQLRSEIEDLGFETSLVKGDEVPEGAKSVEAVMLGALVVTMLPTAITNLLDLLRDWLARNRDIKIKAKIGDQEIEIEYPSTLAPPIDVQQWLATALARREAVTPISTQSGGVNVEDGQVSASGDVIGRDKIISIHAEAGATVIVGQPSSVANDQVTAEADEYQ